MHTVSLSFFSPRERKRKARISNFFESFVRSSFFERNVKDAMLEKKLFLLFPKKRIDELTSSSAERFQFSSDFSSDTFSAKISSFREIFQPPVKIGDGGTSVRVVVESMICC